MMRKRKYNPILLDMIRYTDILKRRGKYYPANNRHIAHNNPGWVISQIYHGSDYLFVSSEHNRVVFVFAGSDDIPDFISDFKAGTRQELDKDGIHAGFNKAYHPFIPDIVHILDNVGARDIYFTGHSRGGALAQLGALSAGALGHRVHCITAGAPRVFNKAMRDYYALLPIYNTNLINPHDIVPALPLKVMGYYRTRAWKVLRPKWWYFLPGMAVAVHKDYIDNLERYT